MQASPACTKGAESSWFTGRVNSDSVNFGSRNDAVKFTLTGMNRIDELRSRVPDFITTMSFPKGRKGGDPIIIEAGPDCDDYVHLDHHNGKDVQKWAFYDAGLPEAEGSVYYIANINHEKVCGSFLLSNKCNTDYPYFNKDLGQET